MFRRLLASAAVLTVLTVGAAGCSSGADSTSSSDVAASAPDPAIEAPAMPPEEGRDLLDSGSTALAFSESAGGAAEATAAAADSTVRSLISTGNVQLRSDDVGEARFEVQKVVDELRGEIAQEETATDDEGDVKRSRLVLRIPSARFADAMTALEETATLMTSSSAVDDVTTKVIDTQVRLRVQRASIRRIALLLDRAQSIRDIVNIEGQLSRRQAALGSLERTAAYLADQTSMATITVSLEQTKDEPAKKKPEPEETGFLAGLDAGWSAFTGAAVGLATAAGAVLPFAVVLTLLGVATWPLRRRIRAGRTARTPSAA
ncbi:hypothetical protein NPS01_13810 [Nocardioides psychrotolerans]|uniref:DUF4349 domain-containing protein n=1 Tax=Nocardioides psychrotolerans TaxID=1005945 RepID=A0A1I3H7P7_9ACTN|nr:DUF4349 domain-containing protein [Nocardioides psychrotolerans]GEP37718.1 hypothetical protein NPS01_13810 [Nocardioides psychrotolerans]SFI31622.1 protein of unknown function [Nocardioides psychrotolerans]